MKSVLKNSDILIVACMLLLSGCGTIITRSQSFRTDALSESDAPGSIPRIYSGTILDVYAVSQNNQIGAMLLWDIPFSIAADSLLLPITIYEQIRYGSFRKKNEDQTNEQAEAASSRQ